MSGLRIWYEEDVVARLTALHQSNERTMSQARRYGMDREAAELCRAVYAGALADVGAAFGLAPTTVLAISTRRGANEKSLPAALDQTQAASF